MKRFSVIAWHAFMEPLRHRVMLVMLLTVYLFLLLATYLWFNNILLKGEISAYLTYIEIAKFNWILFKYITVVMVFLFAPLFRHESLHHYSDLILYRPMPRSIYYIARILGRSLYYPFFTGGIVLMLTILFMLKGATLEFIRDILIQILFFQYIQVLVIGSFLCLLSTIATFWWFHVVYFAGFLVILQQLNFALQNHTLPFGKTIAEAFQILLTSVIKGAPDLWFATYYIGPYHLLRLILSVTLAFSFNFMVGIWLFNKMDL